MDCPMCFHGGELSRLVVRETHKAEGRPQVTRRRVCEHDPSHVIKTVEGPSLLTLDDAVVRGSGKGTNQVPEKFSRARLVDDVSQGVLKKLDERQVEDLVNAVCRVISDQLDRVTEIIQDPETGEAVLVIEDSVIREVVESRLRHGPNRVAHILYALSFRGRVDVPKRTGLRDATEFLHWLYGADQYSDIAEVVPPPIERRIDRWWPPRTPAQPLTVIKRSGETKGFGSSQFTESLKKALLGRHEAAKTAALIATYVMTRLEGQEVVTSAQLASEAVAALRRVDDIAYLRYASIAKGFTSVRQFAREAQGLVALPSPRLIFDKRDIPALLPDEPIDT